MLNIRMVANSPAHRMVIASRAFSQSTPHWKGHSHAQNVAKNKKAEDLKKATKQNNIMRQLKDVTAKGGFDPKMNNKLADLMAEYRKESLPMDSFNKRLEKLKEESEKAKKAAMRDQEKGM